MFDNCIHFPPEFRLAIHKGDAVVLLVVFLEKQQECGGEFSLSRDEIKHISGLGHEAQRSSCSTLKKLGVLSEKRQGLPARMYYRVDIEALAKLLEPHVGDCLNALKAKYGTRGKPWLN